MLGASVYRGPAAFREYWRDVQEIWDHTFRFDPESFSDHGNTVVVVGRGRGRARGSAIDIDQPFAMLFEVRRRKPDHPGQPPRRQRRRGTVLAMVAIARL
jgi:hypothetical protein